MTNHPERRQPAWVADAQAVAAERIAATRWPESDDGAHVLTRDELQQVIRDAVVWGYSRGLRAAGDALLSSPKRKSHAT